jgi:hypothetical protein
MRDRYRLPRQLHQREKIGRHQTQNRTLSRSATQSLGWWAVRPKGTVTLTFKLTGEEKKEIFEATFLVLSQRLRPRFDCLLGYPWLREHGFKLVQGQEGQEGHVVIG